MAAALLAAPLWFHVSYRAMWEGAPDITLTIALVVLLGFVAAWLNLSHKPTV